MPYQIFVPRNCFTDVTTTIHFTLVDESKRPYPAANTTCDRLLAHERILEVGDEDTSVVLWANNEIPRPPGSLEWSMWEVKVDYRKGSVTYYVRFSVADPPTNWKELLEKVV